MKEYSEIEVPTGMGRRKFLEILGASMALAGVTTTGCIRRPVEHIYPESKRPEDTLPGIAKLYATSAPVASAVLGLMVTSTDGRPTKIDGNTNHPTTPSTVPNNAYSNASARNQAPVGPTNAFAQAEILNLYDPERGQSCLKNKNKADKSEVLSYLKKEFTKAKDSSSKPFAILFESNFSPAFYDLLKKVRKENPKALLVEYDSTYSQNRREGLTQLTGKNIDINYDFSKADVIFSIDSDFLGVEGDSIKNAAQFASKRRIDDRSTASTMNRLYCVESNLSVTGAAADHRYALAPSQISDFVVALCQELKRNSIEIPVDLVQKSKAADTAEKYTKWLKSLAKDLLAHKGKAVVVVGDRQPAWMHAVGFLINQSLGAAKNDLVKAVPQNRFDNTDSLESLMTALKDKSIGTLLIMGINPVYSFPADMNIANLIKNAESSFYSGFFPDETAQLATCYMPKPHFLEAWGDTISTDGTYSIRQPLIEPLYDVCLNEYEILTSLIEEKPRTAYQVVRDYASHVGQNNLDFDTKWRDALSVGLFDSIPKFAHNSDMSNSADILNKINTSFIEKENKQEASSSRGSSAGAKQIELEFTLDSSVFDGRYANNAWLQETPDPISKLVWDNALLVSPKTARALGVSGTPEPGHSDVDVVNIDCNGKSMEAPVWEVPGIADNTAILPLGYGRTFGAVAKRSGVNANSIRNSTNWFVQGVSITKANKPKYSLVSTQEHGSMNGTPDLKQDRPAPIRETSIDKFVNEPNFVDKYELLSVKKQKNNLYPFPQNPDQNRWAKQQWGMTIDLTTCIGCNACAVACQAENNISVVGKEEVFKDREMSWIRIDRYFSGDVDNPEMRVLFQPLNCQHCENAPCEAVCPVAATTHSPDGLNDMTYNRCVGTRYCANNCPYKVRRYNFFNYSKIDDERNPLYALQKNPNVTVRFRGVMEKCTYCVHRINTAKNHAIVANLKDKLVEDGTLVTACQSACPTGAIVFGDVADPNSRVSKLKALSQNYSVLNELNTRPRTTYLAKIRNVNPEIG